MSPRRVLILLIAGAAVVGLAIWVSTLRHLDRATQSGDLVLPGLEHGINAVTETRLRKADGTHVTLERDASGHWSVVERGWPAQVNKIRKLLLDLGALNVVEEKTRLPANYPALGVEDLSAPKAYGTEITVVSPPQTWALIIGKPSGAKSGYVRVSNAPQSLLAAPLLMPEADPKLWLETAVVDLPVERVREIEEHPADGAAYTASRQKKDDPHFGVAPLPKGRELSGPGAADSLAAALSGLTLQDVARTTPGTTAAARAVFRTFDGLEVEVTGRRDGSRALISLGPRATQPAVAEEASRLAQHTAGWEFEVPEYKYAALFAPLTQLLKPLPEPKAKAPPAPRAPKAAPAQPGG